MASIDDFNFEASACEKTQFDGTNLLRDELNNYW